MHNSRGLRVKNILILVTYLLLSTVNVAIAQDDSPFFDSSFVATATPNDYEQIVANGGDLFATGPDQRTTLHYAIRYGSAELVDYLIKSGVDISQPNIHSNTPLHWAVAKFDDGESEPPMLKKVKLLIAAGANVNAFLYTGETPLMYAGTIEIAQFLLDSGANLKMKTVDGNSAIKVHELGGRVEVAEFLRSVEQATSTAEVDGGGSAEAATVDQIVQDCEQYITLKSVCWAQSSAERIQVLSKKGFSCDDTFVFARGKMTLCQTGKMKIYFSDTDPTIRFNCENFNVCSYDFREIAEKLIEQGVVEKMDYNIERLGDQVFDVYCGRGPLGDELCVKSLNVEPGFILIGEQIQIDLNVGSSNTSAPSFN